MYSANKLSKGLFYVELKLDIDKSNSIDISEAIQVCKQIGLHSVVALQLTSVIHCMR